MRIIVLGNVARLTLSFLGGWQACLDGRPLTGFESARVRALLAYLAVEAGRPHFRVEVASRLWPEVPETAALANLRQALANLRKTIRDSEFEPPTLVVTRDTVAFDGAHGRVDVTEFTRLLAACAAHRHRQAETCRACAARLDAAAGLYQGDFLAGFFGGESAEFEAWALIWRERLRRQAVEALGRLATYYERRHEWALAQQASAREIELDPWREEAHRRLMRVLAGAGQRTAALAQFETCRRVLADELAVTPTEATRRLYEQIKAAPDAASPDAGPRLQNWPQPATPLIGRETELAELAERLADPGCRLLTILGPGGMGKTRLALAAGADQAWSFRQGAAFVPLAALDSPAYLAPAMAHALGVALAPQAEPGAQLASALRDQERLLVLDNFEHLRGGLALLAEILARAPGVQLVVTSRERLGLPGEWVFELRGLACPDPEQPAPGVETFSAGQLFLDCARRAGAALSLAPAEALAVGRICRLVGGMPLALELAAAWVRVISCAEIAAEIERGLGILATARPEVWERHRSVQAVFEHAWQRLTPDEQRAFRNLAVFRGGFEREAAEAVAGVTLPLLSALVDQSLVRWDRAQRYDLHELIAQFAGEKLRASGEAGALAGRHAAYCLGLAERAEPALRGPAQHVWLDRLAVERHNLRRALEWALEAGREDDLQAGLRLASALGSFWWMHGLGEGRQWLAALLGHPAAGAQTAARARALALAADLAVEQGSRAEAQRWYEESLAIATELGDPQAVAIALVGMGVIARAEGDHARSRALGEQSLAVWRSLGAPWGIAWALHCLGYLAYNQGELERARTLFEECLQIRREVGDQSGVAWAYNGLGEVARITRDYDQARRRLEQGLELHRAVGNKWGVAVLACNLGFAVLNLGAGRRARALFAEGLALRAGAADYDALCVIGLAGVARQPQQAAALLAAAQPCLDPAGSPADRADYDQILARVRAQLDDAAFAAAWQAGTAMSLEQAIALALAAEAA